MRAIVGVDLASAKSPSDLLPLNSFQEGLFFLSASSLSRLKAGHLKKREVEHSERERTSASLLSGLPLINLQDIPYQMAATVTKNILKHAPMLTTDVDLPYSGVSRKQQRKKQINAYCFSAKLHSVYLLV